MSGYQLTRRQALKTGIAGLALLLGCQENKQNSQNTTQTTKQQTLEQKTEIDFTTPERALESYFLMLSQKDSELIKHVYFAGFEEKDNYQEQIPESVQQAIQKFILEKQSNIKINKYVRDSDVMKILELKNTFHDPEITSIELKKIVYIRPTKTTNVGKNNTPIHNREAVRIRFEAEIRKNSREIKWVDGAYFVKVDNKWLCVDDD